MVVVESKGDQSGHQLAYIYPSKPNNDKQCGTPAIFSIGQHSFELLSMTHKSHDNKSLSHDSPCVHL